MAWGWCGSVDGRRCLGVALWPGGGVSLLPGGGVALWPGGGVAL